MSHHRSTVATAVGLLLPLLLLAGCVKRVPPPNGKYDVTDKVILTLKDGRSVEGHIDPGRRVEYRAGGSVYRAQVVSVSKDAIKLDRIVLIDTENSYKLVSSRLAHDRLQTEPPLPPVSLDSSLVSKVELIQVDTAKTFRRAAFWAYASAIFVLLLGERS